ncbi:Putative O-methyltransferase/MSMEI_4947 [Aquisphaera giovannonii]|uniref:O-methyltransferase/MSMEI_4947 n=1 Tax=Aquisphaera giovannonii TaxID=406548 RepID=A0A5B9W5I5_9BACT|nr:O-methyltransferase [Aquisphaera giovannonii]QEH35912.1 Putative O-methyltransferase/MSMEI_4947 [Aquisphaera giovannonii]
MYQRTMGALAFVGGALLAASVLVEAAGPGGPQEASTTPSKGRSIPANSSVPGATDRARERDPLAKDDREAKILAVLDDLDQHRRGTMNVPREDGRMLRVLAESIGAKNVVEIGTSNGLSGLWLCLALGKTGGHLTTFDIDPGRFELAKANFHRAGVDALVTQVLGDAHEEVLKMKDPIDLLFIDADKAGYLDYLNKLLPLVRPGGLIVSHNMASPPPDPEFVKALTTNPALESLFINMHDQGLGVSLKKR